jgi:putative ABC transport system substrate-binding protein
LNEAARVHHAARRLAFAACAQQGTKISRIGVLSPGRSEDSNPNRVILNAFVAGLRELGYAEGQNITIEREFAGPNVDHLRELAAELVKGKVDVIVAFSSTAARPAKQATSVIPIVAIAMADPVEDELVASLARPGGNVTGTTFLGPELVTKRLELLSEAKELVALEPDVIVVISTPVTAAVMQETHTIPIIFVQNFDPVGSGLVKSLVAPDGNITGFTSYEAAMGSKWLELLKGVAPQVAHVAIIYSIGCPVDCVLKGEKPANLPVQQPTKFELVINLTTAKAVGLTIPASILSLADDLIE